MSGGATAVQPLTPERRLAHGEPKKCALEALVREGRATGLDDAGGLDSYLGRGFEAARATGKRTVVSRRCSA